MSDVPSIDPLKHFDPLSTFKDSQFLSKLEHTNGELHYIGEAISAPSSISDVSSAVSYLGVSPYPAREDHVHHFTGVGPVEFGQAKLAATIVTAVYAVDLLSGQAIVTGTPVVGDTVIINWHARVDCTVAGTFVAGIVVTGGGGITLAVGSPRSVCTIAIGQSITLSGTWRHTVTVASAMTIQLLGGATAGSFNVNNDTTWITSQLFGVR